MIPATYQESQPDGSVQAPKAPLLAEDLTGSSTPLALPDISEAERNSPNLKVGGEAIQLDHLGPMVGTYCLLYLAYYPNFYRLIANISFLGVVNVDGTISRIANWDKMTPYEQAVAKKRIAARNKERLDALKAANPSEEAP